MYKPCWTLEDFLTKEIPNITYKVISWSTGERKWIVEKQAFEAGYFSEFCGKFNVDTSHAKPQYTDQLRTQALLWNGNATRWAGAGFEKESHEVKFNFQYIQSISDPIFRPYIQHLAHPILIRYDIQYLMERGLYIDRFENPLEEKWFEAVVNFFKKASRTFEPLIQSEPKVTVDYSVTVGHLLALIPAMLIRITTKDEWERFKKATNVIHYLVVKLVSEEVNEGPPPDDERTSASGVSLSSSAHDEGSSSFSGAHDNGSSPSHAHDEGSSLSSGAHDERTSASGAHDEGSLPSRTHDEGSSPSRAHDEGSSPSCAHDEGSLASRTHDDGSSPSSAHMSLACDLPSTSDDERTSDSGASLSSSNSDDEGSSSSSSEYDDNLSSSRAHDEPVSKKLRSKVLPVLKF